MRDPLCGKKADDELEAEREAQEWNALEWETCPDCQGEWITNRKFMTVARERSVSVHNTREFLRSLLDPKETPRVPKKVREAALRCLRHFPSDYDIERVSEDGPYSVFGYVARRDLK